jgi:colicin import membrane protein
VSSVKPPRQGNDRDDTSVGGGAGARKVAGFFSVEGQRRRLEFARMPPVRAMTPEEETKYLGALLAQEKAAQEKAAQEKAAQEKIGREKIGREKTAKGEAGRGKAGQERTSVSSSGRNDRGRTEDPREESGSAETDRRSGGRARGRTQASRGRHLAEPKEEADEILSGSRSGGRRGGPRSAEANLTVQVDPPAEPIPGTDSAGAVHRGETRPGLASSPEPVSRRGVIGASPPRDEK